jgi:Ran GTPase-activating protein (RanGAP) involved in mRNA processing and transport
VAKAWADSKNSVNLRVLNMANTLLTGAGFKDLAESEVLQKLTHLDVSHNLLGANGAEAFPRCRFWKSLRSLTMDRCFLDDAAMLHLAKVMDAPGLREISLQYNSIGPAGAVALAGWAVMGQLWKVDLHDNFIGDAGLEAIANSPYTVRLLELDLEQDCWNSRSSEFGTSAGMALANARAMHRLEMLYSGMVDEYHWCRYTCGFTRQALPKILESAVFRPQVRASVQTREYDSPSDGFQDPVDPEETERIRQRHLELGFTPEKLQQMKHDHDFRNHESDYLENMRKIVEEWSENPQKKMQQVGYGSGSGN